MDIRADDSVYVIAIRARGDDGGRSVAAVLREIGTEIRGGPGHDYVAEVIALPLADAYGVENGPRTALNQNDTLRILGFDFDAANQVIPVVTEAPNAA
jgi:hypothetical protein